MPSVMASLRSSMKREESGMKVLRRWGQVVCRRSMRSVVASVDPWSATMTSKGSRLVCLRNRGRWVSRTSASFSVGMTMLKNGGRRREEGSASLSGVIFEEAARAAFVAIHMVRQRRQAMMAMLTMASRQQIPPKRTELKNSLSSDIFVWIWVWVCVGFIFRGRKAFTGIGCHASGKGRRQALLRNSEQMMAVATATFRLSLVARPAG